MALCEQCGSIQIVRARSTPLDIAVAFLTGRRPFVCRRCRWRGRQAWSEADILDPRKSVFSSGATADPALAVLDEIGHAPAPRPYAQPQETKAREETQGDPDTSSAPFDLSALDWTGRPGADADAADSASQSGVAGRHDGGRKIRRGRRKRSGRMGRAGSIALAALVLCVFVLLGLSGSCNGR